MAPSITIDETPDFAFPIASTTTSTITATANTRTLFLASPSLSSHPDALNQALEGHDRNRTDIQMLDRLSAGLASLPSATYDVIILLTDISPQALFSAPLLSRAVMAKIFDTLKAGGVLRSQDGSFGRAPGPLKTEAILAGLMVNERGDGMIKPSDTGGSGGVVLLKLGSKRTANGKPSTNGSVPLNGVESMAPPVAPLANVGFVDFADDLDDPIITGEDDDLIDEDDLLTEEDKRQGIIIRKA
jgi:anamorsin